MADYRYAYQGPTQGVAKALARDAGISTKVSIEISNHLRGRTTTKAKALLERVLEMKEAIPFKRFTNGLGHKPGMAAGRYPQKASAIFLKLIKAAEANAAQAGLGEDLVIVHIAAHEASAPFRHGRQGRRRAKQTHVEIVVKEAPEKAAKKPKKAALPAKKTAPEEKAEKASEPEKKKPAVKKAAKKAAKKENEGDAA